MKLFLLLGALTFSFSFSLAQEAMCLSLFKLHKAQPLNLEVSSWNRFHAPLNIQSQEALHRSPLALKWHKKIDSPIPSWNLKYLFKNNDEVYKTIHLSADQTVVITRSNKNILRIYKAESGKLVSTIETFRSDPNSILKTEDRIEVLAFNSDFFVVGTENSYHIRRNLEAGIIAFQPQELKLMNYKGEVIATASTDSRLKGIILDEAGRFWVTADQYEVVIHSLENQSRLTVPVYWQSDLSAADYSVSAIALSADKMTLYVAYSKFKGHQNTPSYISSFQLNSKNGAQFVQKIILPEALAVYRIEDRGNGSLQITYRNFTDENPDSAHVTEIAF